MYYSRINQKFFIKQFLKYSYPITNHNQLLTTAAMLENSIDKSPLTMRNSMLNKALFPVHIYEKLISGKPSMIQLSDMTNTYVSCIMMTFISFEIMFRFPWIILYYYSGLVLFYLNCTRSSWPYCFQYSSSRGSPCIRL